MSEEEAAFTAAMISREIRNRLIGEVEHPDNAYVRSIAARVRVADGGLSDASLQAAFLSELDKELERIEREARQTLHDALRGALCELCPVHGRNPQQVVAGQVLMPPRLERQIASALSALPAKEAAAFDLNACEDSGFRGWLENGHRLLLSLGADMIATKRTDDVG